MYLFPAMLKENQRPKTTNLNLTSLTFFLHSFTSCSSSSSHSSFTTLVYLLFPAMTKENQRSKTSNSLLHFSSFNLSLLVSPVPAIPLLLLSCLFPPMLKENQRPNKTSTSLLKFFFFTLSLFVLPVPVIPRLLFLFPLFLQWWRRRASNPRLQILFSTLPLSLFHFLFLQV